MRKVELMLRNNQLSKKRRFIQMILVRAEAVKSVAERRNKRENAMKPDATPA